MTKGREIAGMIAADSSTAGVGARLIDEAIAGAARAQMEASCRVLCNWCREGLPASLDGRGWWVHAPGIVCFGAKLRADLEARTAQ